MNEVPRRIRLRVISGVYAFEPDQGFQGMQAAQGRGETFLVQARPQLCHGRGKLEGLLAAAEIERHVHDLALAHPFVNPPVVQHVVPVVSLVPELEPAGGERLAAAPQAKETPVAGEQGTRVALLTCDVELRSSPDEAATTCA